MTPGPQLPSDAVVVHIGPYKTGSTAIQSSLHQHRDDLAGHGIWYPGPRQRQARESWSLLGRAMSGMPALPIEVWDRFAADVRARADQRVLLSSEDFCSSNGGQIRKLVDDLGRERVHMVMVARRLDNLIPSAWQERIKSIGETLTFEEFVDQLIDPERVGASGRGFWWNHDLTRILERWQQYVPAERITVLVADESDREQQMRFFEQFLELPGGLLTPGERTNSSLTHERAEFFRQINAAFAERGWSAADRHSLMYRGLLTALMSGEPVATESRIPRIPASADARMRELSDERIAGLRDSGARVVGDLDLLRYTPPADRTEGSTSPTEMTIASASAAVVGLTERVLELRAEQQARTDKRIATLRGRADEREKRAAAALDGISSRQMLREIARRQKNRLRR